jgi:hypothetical protein
MVLIKDFDFLAIKEDSPPVPYLGVDLVGLESK